jgi:hypothetical protein
MPAQCRLLAAAKPRLSTKNIASGEAVGLGRISFHLDLPGIVLGSGRIHLEGKKLDTSSLRQR